MTAEIETRKLVEFLGFSKGASSHDGVSVKLRIEANGVPPLDLAIPHDRIGDMMQYLAHLAADAAQKRSPSESFPKGAVEVSPIPATQVALMLGSPGKAILVIGLSDYSLGFELPLAALQDALPSYTQIATVLASEPTSRN